MYKFGCFFMNVVSNICEFWEVFCEKILRMRLSTISFIDIERISFNLEWALSLSVPGGYMSEEKGILHTRLNK